MGIKCDKFTTVKIVEHTDERASKREKAKKFPVFIGDAHLWNETDRFPKLHIFAVLHLRSWKIF